MDINIPQEALVAGAGILGLTCIGVGYLAVKKIRQVTKGDPIVVEDISYDPNSHRINVTLKNTDERIYLIEDSAVRLNFKPEGEPAPKKVGALSFMSGRAESPREMFDLIGEDDKMVVVKPGHSKTLSYEVIPSKDNVELNDNTTVSFFVAGEEIKLHTFDITQQKKLRRRPDSTKDAVLIHTKIGKPTADGGIDNEDAPSLKKPAADANINPSGTSLKEYAQPPQEQPTEDEYLKELLESIEQSDPDMVWEFLTSGAIGEYIREGSGDVMTEWTLSHEISNLGFHSQLHHIPKAQVRLELMNMLKDRIWRKSYLSAPK